MKKILTMLLFAGILATPAFAQFELILGVGVNVSDYKNTDLFESSNRLGMQAGGVVRLGRAFYVEPGIYWTSAGSDISFAEITDNVSINGVKIPLTIGYKLLRIPVVKVRIFAGVAVTAVTSVNDNAFGLTKDNFESGIWSARVGAGVDILFLSLDLGYEPGLSNVLKSLSGETTDSKLDSFFATLGFRLAL